MTRPLGPAVHPRSLALRTGEAVRIVVEREDGVIVHGTSPTNSRTARSHSLASLSRNSGPAGKIVR